MKADRARRRKAEVIAALKEHITEFGERDWGRVLRRFPKISSASFWRYVREARAPEVDPEAEPFIEPAVAELAAQRPRSLKASIRALQRSAARQRERNALFEPDYVETPHEPLSVKPEQLGALMERYAAEVLSHLRTGDKQRRSLRRIIDPLAHVLSTDLSDAMVEEIIDDIAQTAPVHANRILGYFSAFCSWAVGERAMISSRWAVVKPAEERPRDRRLSLEEVVTVWRATRGLGFPFGPAIRLLIATAASRQQVAAFRFEELGRTTDGQVYWRLTERNHGEQNILRSPLSPLAVRVIEEALATAQHPQEFAFSMTGQTPISGWGHAKGRLDRILAASAEGCLQGPWRLNDLRPSFAAICRDELDMDEQIVGRCLARMSDFTRPDDRFRASFDDFFAERQVVMLAWGSLLEDVLGDDAAW